MKSSTIGVIRFCTRGRSSSLILFNKASFLSTATGSHIDITGKHQSSSLPPVLAALKSKSFLQAIEVYESLIKTKFAGCNDDLRIQYGAAVAYSKVGDSRSIGVVFANHPQLEPSIVANLIVQSHCRAMRLNAAEMLIINWLKSYSVSLVVGSDIKTAVDKLLRNLNQLRHEPVKGEDYVKTFKRIIEPSGIESQLPSADTWFQFVLMYANRNLWIQCLSVLSLVEKLYDNKLLLPCGYQTAIEAPQSQWLENMYDVFINSLCALDKIEMAFDIYEQRISSRGLAMKTSFLVSFLNVFKYSLSRSSSAHLPESNNNLIQLSECFLRLIQALYLGKLEDPSNTRWKPSVTKLNFAIVDHLSGRGLAFEAQQYLNVLKELEVKIFTSTKQKAYLPSKAIYAKVIKAHCDTHDWRAAMREYNNFFENYDQADTSKRNAPLMKSVYHRVAQCLRIAGQSEELSAFMLQYGEQTSHHGN